MKLKLNSKIFSSLTLIILITGCKKFLDVGAPVSSVNGENVYQYDNTAAGVLTGIYAQISGDFNNGGITSVSLLSELSADNLILFDPTQTQFLDYYRNSLRGDYINTSYLGNYFGNFYPMVYDVNAAIEGINGSNTLSTGVKNRLLGEAYFLRAFYYTYLVQLFGDVPLVLTTDYAKNSTIARSPAPQVYQQIISDLNQSIGLLDNSYVDASVIKSTDERVRPNRATALALLSRVQLYRKDFVNAELAASQVINQTSIYDTIPLNQVFLKNSKETIWAIQPTKTGFNTDEGNIFLLPNGPNNADKPFYLSPSLVQSFENGDRRSTNWVGMYSTDSTNYYYSTKYKADANTSNVIEYTIVFRLAEQYLIRAEARAEQGNISGAQADLNVIRFRSGLPVTTANNLVDLRTAILKERRVELFTEWGHRWLDLKRSGKADAVMQNAAIQKGGNWVSTDVLYPIPNSEIIRDGNLTQNPGY